jgi:hypothetical protein
VVDEQQLADQFLGDVGTEVHDDRLHGLAQGQLPRPAPSGLPYDTLPDASHELIELLRREPGSSLAWQWSLRVGRFFGENLPILPLGPLPFRLRHARHIEFLDDFCISLML